MKKKTEKKLSLGKISIAGLHTRMQDGVKGGLKTIEAACNTNPISVCPCISQATGPCISDPC
ncbi:MAG TPA: class I lanthipeptide [Chitinophaga sp.]|uniref:class I lanthipeptide n=1 Tax=Chitinophaga sp. TaxID=1869181 RepID=UPI002BBC95AA|nr:class I lanthipeptide [Chitinophaga sp.]HVI43524.1 class I lanthipeptide [Chitinophaga sp.]